MIFLPVELSARDLLGRFYLAFEAGAPGDHFVIGRHDVLWPLVKANPGSVYVGKHVFLQCGRGNDPQRLAEARAAGVQNIWLDDEGFAAFLDVDAGGAFWEARCDPSLFGEESCIAAWGERHGVWHRERVAPKVPVVITGNPRFELSKPGHADYFAPEIERITRRYGQFVLINSRFGIVFPSRPFEFNFAIGITPSLACEEFAHAAEFLRAIRSLAVSRPDVRFVFRPHPGEDPHKYELLFADLGNVAVVLEGEVIPWLHASACVIHNSCTTGIEATLAGKPVVAYLPEHLNGVDGFDQRRAAANLTSLLAQTPDDLVRATDRMLGGAWSVPASIEEVARHIENLRTDGACVLSALIRERVTPDRRPNFGRWHAWQRIATEPLRRIRRELNPIRRGETRIVRREFPPMSAAVVQRFAGYFSGRTGKPYTLTRCNPFYCVLSF